jgi:hypothetical protein
LFSVALSLTPLSPAAPVGVTHHRVLSCSDFPHRRFPDGAAAAHTPLTFYVAIRRAFASGYPVHMPPPLAPETIAWTDARHASTVTALLDLMGGEIQVIGIGGPRVPEVDDLARRLGVPRGDDLRQLIVDRPATFLLLAAAERCGEEDLAAAAAQNTTILTVEPLIADLGELTDLQARTRSDAHRVPRVALVPAFTQSPGFLRAADPRDVLGERRLVAFESAGRPGAGSLFARLFDAWHTVLGFTPLPESIDASLTAGPGPIPDDLRRITGQLAAHARIPGGHNAILHACDTASDNRRYLHVLTPDAELRITDTGYDLRHADGTVVDRGDPRPAGIAVTDLIASQWRRLLDRPSAVPAEPSPRDAQALACCFACALSARTGQPESPTKLLALSA